MTDAVDNKIAENEVLDECSGHEDSDLFLQDKCTSEADACASSDSDVHGEVENDKSGVDTEPSSCAETSAEAEQADSDKKTEPGSGIPGPAAGDVFVFTADVDKYVEESGRNCMNSGGSDDTRFAVLENDNDALSFVVCIPTCEKTVELMLTENQPGFDSIILWRSVCSDGSNWLVCVHLPVSGRLPVPEACRDLVYPASFEGMLADTIIQAYDLTNVTTLRSWRESQSYVSPTILYDLIERIGSSIEGVFQRGHAIVRVSQDTIVLSSNEIRFMAVKAVDLPWNERCALAHHQVEYAAVPPECSGFLRQRLNLQMGVYVVAALAYFLVAGVRIPTCEALGYAVALDPRAFYPEFPLGWDDIIQTALRPNPDLRYASISDFTHALRDRLDAMYERRDFRSAVNYDVAVDTHIGVTKRLRCPVNQDAVYVQSTEDGQRILMVVADGVSTSTYGSGDIASHIVVDEAKRAWEERIEKAENLNSSAEISNILERSNKMICQYIRDRFADRQPVASECMGTTALVAIIENGVMTLGSIGDSRAYLVRNDSMTCITRDHNLFTIGIINGLPVETCAVHPHAGSLVMCLGYYDESEEPVAISFDLYSMHLIPGDMLMLTTDGILDYVNCDLEESERQIACIIRNAPNSTVACLQLITQANLGGGGDNCGVGIVKVSAG